MTGGAEADRNVQERLRFIIVLWGEVGASDMGQTDCPVYTFNNVMEKSKSEIVPVSISPDTLATLVYTSGTTGSPKVMLTQIATCYHA